MEHRFRTHTLKYELISTSALQIFGLLDFIYTRGGRTHYASTLKYENVFVSLFHV